MAEHDDREQRTEDATPRRRDEAREKGQVPYSGELVAAVGLVGGAAVLGLGGAELVRAAAGEIERGVGVLATLGTAELTVRENLLMYARYFDIPTRVEGDCLARYLLRVDEVKQSLRIIDQCLHQMPDGPVMAKLPRLLRPRPGRAYSAVESPRGQYATYVVSDGTDQPFRMRIHDPSYIHLQSVGLLMQGNLIADTMAIMASLDPIMGGVDK